MLWLVGWLLVNIERFLAIRKSRFLVSNSRPEERGGRPKRARYTGESGTRAENRAEEGLYS
jgi:hypothetical protein